ncbi:hypothetical protein GWI33_007289 [Rhynchophorus ferrugineus]|uniref:Uncharacterized protein n=1 Tax=Rhynchophorus ferrugineus TaxID=354439 RepID=A0A834MD57_RHYFE|nr:hypothetical protein GWI33_007289 [Rhynchophorus ferrugineus]
MRITSQHYTRLEPTADAGSTLQNRQRRTIAQFAVRLSSSWKRPGSVAAATSNDKRSIYPPPVPSFRRSLH